MRVRGGAHVRNAKRRVASLTRPLSPFTHLVLRPLLTLERRLQLVLQLLSPLLVSCLRVGLEVSTTYLSGYKF